MVEKKHYQFPILDSIALSLIGLYCILFSICGARFAELHIQFKFLDFPIFISELLILVLLPLGVLKILNNFQHKKLLLVVMVYAIWVLSKAFTGYFQYGPLALRNAMLFIYPIFTIYIFLFFDPNILKNKIIQYALISLITGVSILFSKDAMYYWWTYLMLGVVLISALNKSKIKLAFLFLWCFFVLISFKNLFLGSRSHMVSVLVVFILLSGYIVSVCSERFSKKYKYIAWAFIVGIFFVGSFKFADRNSLKSLIRIDVLMDYYRHYEKYIEENKNEPSYRYNTINLYNPDELGHPENKNFILSRIETAFDPLTQNNITSRKETTSDSKLQNVNLNTSWIKTTSVSKISSEFKESESKKIIHPVSKENVLSSPNNEKESEGVIKTSLTEIKDYFSKNCNDRRQIETAYTNILFRYFLWRDMWREVWHKKAWGGVSFGEPQRSRSIEILHWGEDEWRRDGWMTPHNSFMHIYYRSGMVGIILIITLFFTIFSLTKYFWTHRSFIGICLVSTLIYWLVLSMFLVLLELPYTAIVFWSLLGLTLKYKYYLKSLQNSEGKK